MSLRVWWLVAIFTLAVGASIVLEEPPASPEARELPAAQAARQPAPAGAQRNTVQGS
jgi:hypothetical protein